MNTLLKLTLAAATLAAAPAFAQDGTVTLSETSNGGETPAIDAAPASGGRYPLKFATRPLTLSKMHLRGEADILIPRVSVGLSSDFGFLIFLGASFGITDDIEVGTTLIPLVLAPNAAYGDIPVYGRYRFLKGNFELGAQAGIVIPTNRDFGLSFGLVSVLHANNLRLDVSALFKLAFSSPDAGKGLSIPVQLSYNINDMFYAQVRTGVNLGVAELTPGAPLYLADFGTLVIPLGIGGFYTIAKGDVPMLDVGLTFDWPLYLQTGGGDALSFDNFTIGLAARFHLFL